MFDNFLIHTFHDGNCLQAYKIFGAHFETHEGKKGVRFTTYAPNARSAQVVGEFNQWGETPCYIFCASSCVHFDSHFYLF